MAYSFPILARTYRTQWRGRNFFALLFGLTLLFSAFLLWRYAAESVGYGDEILSVQQRLQRVGRDVWLQLAFLQTAVALLVAPALSAGSIARERERGLLDGLILAPLSPARIVCEKALSALAPVAPMFLVLLPFDFVAILLGGQGIGALGATLGFQLLLAATCAAIGLACSAWSQRAHRALGLTYGLTALWVLVSFGAALLAGDSYLGKLLPAYVAPIYVVWLGHTNPILGAADLIVPDAPGDYWLGATLTLPVLLALSLWSATRALRKPLVEAPFLGGESATKTRKKRAANAIAESSIASSVSAAQANTAGASNATASTHCAVPVVGVLHFANPILGREVRSKFRMRQPPPGVIFVEIVLALAVACFYALTLWTAFHDPSARTVIFYGVAITGLIVTLISCAIMGANGFAREHEGGTWESLRLSMLRPREIVRGKAAGITLTCLLFSIPVWPLLLPCIAWDEPWPHLSVGDEIAVSQLAALALIWLGCVFATTMWGLWLGRRARVTSVASGFALGTSALWLIGLPLALVLSGAIRDAEGALILLHPFFALFETDSIRYGASDLGLPFVTAALCFGAFIWALLERGLTRDFG